MLLSKSLAVALPLLTEVVSLAAAQAALTAVHTVGAYSVLPELGISKAS